MKKALHSLFSNVYYLTKCTFYPVFLCYLLVLYSVGVQFIMFLNTLLKY